MKEKESTIDPSQFKWTPPSPLASIVIDPTRYSHLVVYEEYCQVMVGNILSPAIDKQDAETILREIKTIDLSYGLPTSKLTAIKYTPMTVKVGKCVLVGKSGYEGLVKSLELYVKDGPYIKDDFFINNNTAGKEIIAKEKVGNVDLFAWWDIKKYGFGSSVQLIIVGPYETFKYAFKDKEFIDQLIEGVEYLLYSDALDFKIDISDSQGYNPNLRLFKQMVGDDPVIGISTDVCAPNQRALIFSSEKSGKRFLSFLRKANSSF